MSDQIISLSDEQIQAIVHSPQLANVVRQPSPWMTLAEVAEYIGIALGTLRNWTSGHFIPFAKKGRVVRYHRDVIDKWLSKGACAGRTTIADVKK